MTNFVKGHLSERAGAGFAVLIILFFLSPVVGCGGNSRTGPLDFLLVRLLQDTRIPC